MLLLVVRDYGLVVNASVLGLDLVDDSFTAEWLRKAC